MAKIDDADHRHDDDWQDFYATNYVSSSALLRDDPYPGRSGKVKRAPTLAELEGDDTDYYSPDDVYFEDRRK